MKPHILETVTIINKPLDVVFDFFSKAENLNALTPPELEFKILVQNLRESSYKDQVSKIMI